MTRTFEFPFNRSPGTALNEQTLILHSKNGDQEAFACLFDAYLERIYRYVYFRVQDEELAQDISSLVFLRAWENMHKFQNGPSPFAGWLYRIAHNAVIDHYRVTRKMISLEEVDASKIAYSDEVDETMERKVRSRELSQALMELSHTQQQVLTLKFILGFTTLEIAHMLHKRVGAIRTAQMRGLKRMATILPSQKISYPGGDPI